MTAGTEFAPEHEFERLAYPLARSPSISRVRVHLSDEIDDDKFDGEHFVVNGLQVASQVSSPAGLDNRRLAEGAGESISCPGGAA